MQIRLTFYSLDATLFRLCDGSLCNLPCATDCMGVWAKRTILTSQMNHHVIWIGRQQGYKQVNRKCLLISTTLHFLFSFVRSFVLNGTFLFSCLVILFVFFIGCFVSKMIWSLFTPFRNKGHWRMVLVSYKEICKWCSSPKQTSTFFYQ